MFQSRRKIHSFYFFIDIFLVAVSFFLPYILIHNSLSGFIRSQALRLPNFNEYFFVYVLWFIFLVALFRRRNLYVTDRNMTIPKEVFNVTIGIVYAGMLILAVIFFAKYRFFSRGVYGYNIVFLFITLNLWRVIKRLVLRRLIMQGLHNVNVLIVGTNDLAKSALSEIKRHAFWGFRVVGFLSSGSERFIDGVPVLGGKDHFSDIVKKHFVDEVIIASYDDKKDIRKLIERAKEMRLGVRVIADIFGEYFPVLNLSYLGILPLLTYKERVHHPADFILKRLFDFMVSLILLIIFISIFSVIAVVIKLTSPGPVFYKHKRVGLKGRLFNFYKFRSMVNNADKLKGQLLDKNEVKDGVIFKIKNDPRVTSFGRFMRRYSIDELPQLFNVLKGDMSLVGPRPPTPDEVEKYNHNQMQRLSIRPGITGLSQVRGRSELTFYHWVRWDLWYINNWSFGLDLRILFWTIPAITKGKGAY